jgi:hypothetical protein
MFLSKIRFFVDHPAFITMITGLLIILVVMFFPGGFAQMLAAFRGWLRRKRIERRIRAYVDDRN